MLDLINPTSHLLRAQSQKQKHYFLNSCEEKCASSILC